MMVLKDDQVEIGEKDLIAEPALHEEEHAVPREVFGTAMASNGEIYFENNTFWNKAFECHKMIRELASD